MANANQVVPGIEVKIDYVIRKKTTLADAARDAEVPLPYFTTRFYTSVEKRNPTIYTALLKLKRIRYAHLTYDEKKLRPDLTDIQTCGKFFL